VFQAGDNPCLALEAGEKILVLAKGVVHNFDRHTPLELRVFGKIDGCHAARADHPHDLVLPDKIALLESHLD